MPYESSGAASDVSLAPFGLRIIRAMQPAGVGSAHRGETSGGAIFARESAGDVAGVLPSGPSGPARWGAACSGVLQRGQVSPTAHRTLSGTAERQAGQRIRARTTIGVTNRLGQTSRARSLRLARTHRLETTQTPLRKARLPH